MINKTHIGYSHMFAVFTDTDKNEKTKSKLSFRVGRHRAI